MCVKFQEAVFCEVRPGVKLKRGLGVVPQKAGAARHPLRFAFPGEGSLSSLWALNSASWDNGMIRVTQNYLPSLLVWLFSGNF